MDPITMMVASIGMQFFNNYANSKKNAEIQEKQREFQKAAAEHDFERMRKLQAESAKLALELEAEVHKERVEDINSNYDALLENFAHSFAIQNWPLNVLPFIMKGESFGSLFNGTTQSVNMHCIFTPSNCDWFNEMFYDDIDLRLEAEMNNNWNAQSTHPIVYYGGGWSRRPLKHGVSQPNPIDLDDIELLRTKLKNVPVLVVTPYFDPWLHFRVRLWGMGKDCGMPYRIDIPHGDDVDISKRIFSYDYNKDVKEEMTDDFSNTTIEEFVPYLESLIGFVADKYFWTMYHIVPLTPTYIASKEALRFPSDIRKLYLSEVETKQEYKTDTLYDIERKLEYIESLSVILDRKKCQTLEIELLSYANSLIGLSDNQISTLSELKEFLKGQEVKIIADSIKRLQDIDSIEYKKDETDYLDLSEYARKFKLFIERNADRFDINSASMYIRHQAYNTFDIHVYDMGNQCFVISKEGFDYKISARKVKNIYNVKSIFKNKIGGYILCRYNRIEKLIEELNNTNILIY